MKHGKKPAGGPLEGKSRRIQSLILPVLMGLALFGCQGGPPAADPELSGAMDKTLNPQAEALVRTGILHHDQGYYETALEYYRNALELAPDHPVIYYEMAFAYIAMGENQSALELADKGLVAAGARDMDEIIPTLLDLKGSALDNLGRSDEAIETYLTAINQYEVANTLLYFNLGLSYYRIEKRDEARETLVKGLRLNPNHPSSNYLLGRICMEGGEKTQAFYALCYFLLLEPNTERAAEAYNTILYMLDRQEEAIGVRNNGAFTASDMIISLSFTLDEANAGKSDAEKFQAKLYYVITNLEEQKNSGKIGRGDGDELWWDYYSPFFYRIAKSERFGTFCRYIGITSDPEANEWIQTGRDEIEGFFEWLNEYPDS
ncbi:MAG: tetratricopeptide repeat protein [Spirochaetaceae bacterium]|jgi:tetratricopeptide (TPR) repeat protein|nr:tetratricopeptide repeat protein [Spirochaetaceae bacterium]